MEHLITIWSFFAAHKVLGPQLRRISEVTRKWPTACQADMEALKVIQTLLEYTALAAYSPEVSPRHCWNSSPSSRWSFESWKSTHICQNQEHLCWATIWEDDCQTFGYPHCLPTSNAWDGAFRKGHLKHLGQQSSTPFANPEQVLHLICKVH